MNDDIIISPKIQPTPAPTQPDAAPNDTEEQDTVTDRVFDFTDGEIKRVTDVDGPVTHSVNLQIAEALRNPGVTIGKEPLNKLDNFTPQQAVPTTKPIPHPPIDLNMQAPAVKIYSQIPRVPVESLPQIDSTPQTKEKVSPPSLQDTLNKIQGQTQTTSQSIKENLLKKNIATIDPNPFAPQKRESTLPSVPTKVIDATSSILSNANQPSGIPGTSNQFSELLKPLRTYEGDVANLMSHKKTSTASITIAETSKSTGEERISNSTPTQNSHTTMKVLMTMLILILLGGGVFGGYYLYSKSPLATSVSPIKPEQQKRAGIVRADSYVVIPVDNRSPTTVLSHIQTEAAKMQNSGTIQEIILVRKNTTDPNSTLTQIGAKEALSEFDIDAPDILTRTLTPDWMLGIYTDVENKKGAFAIVTTNFFQNAFAGMLQWETVMADDLRLYLEPNLTLRGRFEDRIIKNKDVRAFRSDSGSILFLYSFIDNTHLAIAGDEATLGEILSRLEKQSSIR